MKNVRKAQLKKCIFLTLDEFEDILFTLYPQRINVDISLDGMTVYDEEDCISTNDLNAKLAEYFDVKKVTSTHIDDCDVVGIWIVYED